MNFDSGIEHAPQNILFAILSWGLGHATRSIPIIKKLIHLGHRVVIASDGAALLLLKQQFPQLRTYNLPAYNMTYNSDHIEWSVLRQSNKILKAIYLEHKRTGRICTIESIDWIISDSRFGVRHKTIRSTIITHQLNLQSNSKVLGYLGNRINQYLIQCFDECWVPDNEKHLLSGNLSRKNLNIPVQFIGKQSRFVYSKEELDIDVLIILSGPEPRRTDLEKHIINTVEAWPYTVVIVRGVVQKEEQKQEQNGLCVYNYLNSDDLNQLLNRSKVVVSRSGYSSVMDYVHLQKKAILIPTPGQTEQVYLANYLKNREKFLFLEESRVSNSLKEMVDKLIMKHP